MTSKSRATICSMENLPLADILFRIALLVYLHKRTSMFYVTTMYIERCVFSNSGAKNGGTSITHSSYNLHLFCNSLVYDRSVKHYHFSNCTFYTLSRMHGKITLTLMYHL